MKKLTTEEKAEAYDKAIERAKRMFSEKELNYLFPEELAESEDERNERIRKDLLQFVRNWVNGDEPKYTTYEKECNEMITYLEKQCKSNMGISEATKQELEDNLNKALEKETPESLNEFLDEQKPVDKNDICNHKTSIIQWKGNNLKEVMDFTGKDKNLDKWFKSFEEYEQYVQEHDNIFKLFNTDGSHYEVPVGAWIVKTPDGYNVASKAAFVQNIWSKEDDIMTHDIDYALRCQIAYPKSRLSSMISWIYELKDRVQPKQKWSEEDEAKRNTLIGLVKEIKNQPLKRLEDWDGYISWLKSLKPQTTWKPSDEQMDVIEAVINNRSFQRRHLDSLYADLKKLK